jgi:hypothetical protein
MRDTEYAEEAARQLLPAPDAAPASVAANLRVTSLARRCYTHWHALRTICLLLCMLWGGCGMRSALAHVLLSLCAACALGCAGAALDRWGRA